MNSARVRLLQFFREHPASVGETYTEHMRSAFSFGLAMLGASLACMLHGLLPCVFKTTGSDAVRRLYDRMVLHRQKAR